MSYKPRSLFRIIEEINVSLFLPHIQRPFVWDTDQMRKLFDSLMRNYPIQTFLFWRTTDEIKARKFMSCVEWEPNLSKLYNEQKSQPGIEKVFVLDGQQRIQTLYALFAGTIEEEKTGAKLEAYLDVTSGETLDAYGILFPLKFAQTSPGASWYRLADLIAKHGKMNPEEIGDELNDRLDTALGTSDKARERRVRRNVAQLASLVYHERHFWIEELDGIAQPYPYEVILDIFVRVNSGGTKLNPGDLMFAAMKQRWHEVETEVEDVTEMLNGLELGFDKTFPLKCLVVAHGTGADVTPAKFNGAGGETLLQTIQANWATSEAGFEQLHDFLRTNLNIYSEKLVQSYGSLVPVFDFIFHNPKPPEAARRLMKAYYYKAQLFRWFGASTDTLINALHSILGKPLHGVFPIEDVKAYFSKAGHDVVLTREHLQNARLRNILLSIIYVEEFGASPFQVRFKDNLPHIDHIFPKSGLAKSFSLGSEEINHLGNFRFLGAADNNRKRAEKPDSYFGRLKAVNIPIEKHLLLKDVSNDPSLLKWELPTYRSFRDRRFERLFEIASSVVNAELAPTGKATS